MDGCEGWIRGDWRNDDDEQEEEEGSTDTTVRSMGQILLRFRMKFIHISVVEAKDRQERKMRHRTDEKKK